MEERKLWSVVIQKSSLSKVDLRVAVPVFQVEIKLKVEFS